ncbi:MAG: hypothetical protein RL227_2248, partial [Pseudomonadota bacterium]
AIVQSLASCAENFLGALVVHHALIDPACAPDAPVDPDLARLLAAQLGLDAAGAMPSVAAPRPVPTTVARHTPRVAVQAAPKTLSPAAGLRRAVAQR